ncbi:HAD family hydrolase [Hamadaea tsunoensis]|uniref:HAD family hydrolase n=1 Tax=Hamadaea tsunoensis TaxID=53368 RepID=UPI0004127B1D|nr:HAD family hydrolase [Hamadaea tsunoensis]
MRHLVWDWNGTLLNDMPLVVSSTNAALVAAGGLPTTEDEHRRDFRRPIIDYYGETLGRVLTQAEFARLDEVFHQAYKTGLETCDLAGDARTALGTWTGTQSLLSMWFHDELVPTVDGFGLTANFRRVDGLKTGITGGFKAEHLIVHLKELGIDGSEVVMIGDSVDDADAAAAVGAACVLYTGGFTDPRRLRAVGVPVADSLLEAVAIASR